MSDQAKTVLVAGGAGYIGSHVCYRLAGAGYQPLVLDDLSAGHRWAVKWGDLVVGDIADAALVRDLCHRYRPCALMNFAALTDAAQSVIDPDPFFAVNRDKAKTLFSTVQAAGVRAIVFSGTAAVYGVPGADGRVDESMSLRPANPYGESKKQAEAALFALEGVDAVSLRYFNAAGAADADAGIGEAHWPETNLIPRVILSALGLIPPIEIFGDDFDTPDGTAIRDYIHVLDLADAHIAALDHALKGGRGVFNLGTGTGCSVRQVLDSVTAIAGQAPNCRIGPRRAGDVPVMVANPARAGEVLHWRARYGLDDIVRSALRWHGSDFYRATVPQ